MKTIILAILSLLILPLHTKAQATDMTVDRYSTENGLPSTAVYGSLRDRDGLLWLGTWYGLMSYDGTKFTQYATRRDTKSDIPPRKVITIVEDNRNNLWIRTTDNRLFRFDKTTERFNDMYSELKGVSKNMRVIKVQAMDNGNTLLYTRDKCLYEVFTDKENNPAIKPIYNSRHDIDRTTMRLKHNVVGETADYIFWLGPNFEVATISKPKSLKGKRMISRPGRGVKATCFGIGNGLVMIGTANGYAISISMKTGQTRIIHTTSTSPINTITTIGTQTYLSTADGIYDVNGKLVSAIKTKAETAFADKEGKLWIYGLADGLTMFDPKTKATAHFATPMETTLDAVKFCDAGDNGLFVLLRNGKVWRYDRTTKRMGSIDNMLTSTFTRQLTPTFLNEQESPSFSDINIDRDGLLWLSSTNSGLFKVRFPHRHISYLLSSLLAGDTNPNDNNYGIRALYQSRDGLLWIGTRRGNVYCVDLMTNSVVRKYNGTMGIVYNIMEDRSGNIWLASKGGGLTKATPDKSCQQGMRLTTYRHNANDRYSLSNDKVYYTFQDSKDRIWVCTYGGGLNLIANRSGKTVFINKNNELKQYPHNDLYLNVRQIAEDNDHTLWVATTDGLLSFGAGFKAPKDITINDYRRGDNPTVVDNDIFSIFKDSNGSIWLSIFGCSTNRIMGYDKRSGKLHLESMRENNMVGNIVSTMTEDHHHRLWLTTENGLTNISFSDSDHSVRTYGFLDGVMRNKVEDNSSICLSDGRILMGCREGIIVFSPDELDKDSRHDYKTIIVDFKVQNRSLDSFSPAISEMSPRYAKEIVLNHDQNMFSIEFTTPNFIDNSRTTFKYILDGYENEWHLNDNSRLASYANVPPGKYTFRVKSVYDDSPECTILITVLPPWWATWWAYAIYFILLCLAIYAGIRLSLYMIRMRNEVYINDRLAELKIRFFTNVSHELRTPLTLIKSPIEELKRRETLSSEGKEYLQLIDRNASKMLHLVNQILDLRKLQNKKMRLQLSHADINAIAEAFCTEYRLAAKDRNITLSFNLPEKPVMAWCDAEKIAVIVNNLLSNAFKYTDHGGNIALTLTADYDADICRITVSDDGVGIPEKQLEKIFERFSMADNAQSSDSHQHGTGIGLSLSREFTALHHGRIWAENLADGKGVAFTLEIPMSKEKFKDDDHDILLGDNINPQDLTYAGDTEGISSDAADKAAANDDTHSEDQYRPTLVLAEDNSDLRRMLQLQLSHSYHVVTATDGADALEKILDVHPDLIITDLMMPRMDGVELLKRVRRDFSVSHVPVIVLTAKNGDDDMMKAIATGANAFITKPFSHEMLATRIQQLLREQSIFQRKMVLQAKNSAEPTAKGNGYEDHLAKKDLQFVDRIRTIIEENLRNNDFNIDTIAEGVGLSRSAFFKKLKSLTGLAPVDLVREIRLDKAEKLVVTTDKSASEIAYEVGFKESSYFGKCFKKKFGMTPLEYRNKQTSKDNNVNM